MKIADRYQQIYKQIREVEKQYDRDSGSVCLLAVSKKKTAMDIAEIYRRGQRHFAESYLQESLAKQSELAAFNIIWHFIGPIQSNKTALIARHFSWVHSVDRLKIAQRLSQQRPDELPDLNICIQVNISSENSKSGIELEALPALVEKIEVLPRIKLRGLMAIPKPEQSFEHQREPFKLIHTAVTALNNPDIDTFSYGMSADFKAAIAEGATIVRIGTALFGARSD